MRAPTTVGQQPDAVDTDLDLGLAELLQAGRCFPTPELVGAAAALFVGGPRSGWVQGVARSGARRRWEPQLPAFYAAQLDREFFVRVAGGTVALRCEDTNRTEATAALRRASTHSAAYFDVVDGDHSALAGLLAPGEALPAADPQAVACEDQTRRPSPGDRHVTSWSRKSRASMTRCLAELDYAPLFAQPGTPAMVTLTYPGDWQAVVPDGRTCKRHLQTLLRRWARTWCAGATVPLLWKLEFQRRGAPHFHLFAVPPHGRRSCSCRSAAGRLRCATVVDDGGVGPCGAGQSFTAWLSATWAEVVASSADADSSGSSEHSRHVLAGTGIDYREGDRARDPKRLAVYFSKHGGGAGGKEYQHVVPELWLARPDTGPGRYWGYNALYRVVAEASLCVQDYVTLRRTLRRLSESQRVARTLRVPRGPVVLVDLADGELTRVPPADLGPMVGTGLYALGADRARRTVTRRRRRLAAGGLAGGFLCVNDGPALASQLAGLLVDGPARPPGGLGAWLRASGPARGGQVPCPPSVDPASTAA